MMILLTTETRRAQRELYFLGRRRSGKRSQPCGHDLVTGLLHINGWSQAKELSPKAEALFPGRRQPAIASRSGEAGGSPGQGKNNILRDLCASVVNTN